MTISLLRHPRCSYRTTTPRPLLYPKLAALSFRALLFSSSVVQTQLVLSHNERVSQKSLETSEEKQATLLHRYLLVCSSHGASYAGAGGASHRWTIPRS